MQQSGTIHCKLNTMHVCLNQTTDPWAFIACGPSIPDINTTNPCCTSFDIKFYPLFKLKNIHVLHTNHNSSIIHLVKRLLKHVLGLHNMKRLRRFEKNLLLPGELSRNKVKHKAILTITVTYLCVVFWVITRHILGRF